MKEYSTDSIEGSSGYWEQLDAFARLGVQKLLQQVLEEEITDLLGRQRSERRDPVDCKEGYRNGYGKPRMLSMSCGTIVVRRPRVRDLTERFESKILPLFKRRTQEVGRLLPELYLHGLSEGDFDLALRGLLGEGAPLSGSSIARLKASWQTEYELWRGRSLTDLEVIYLWVDGIYVKAGLEKEKAAVVVAVEAGHRESIESWSSILRDLKGRGMKGPRLVIGDGHLGIWGALSNVYPDSKEQRCWNHRIVNVLDKVAKKEQAQASALL